MKVVGELNNTVKQGQFALNIEAAPSRATFQYNVVGDTLWALLNQVTDI